ncbi:MAG: hypothetical protein EOP11_22175, partial [Proteobacteria bacterium]
MDKTGSKGLVFSFGLCLMAASAAANANPAARAYREGELIVKYRDGSSRSFNQMQNSYQRLSVVNVQRFESSPFKNFETLSIDTNVLSLTDAASELRRDPSVEYVQPNYLVYAHQESAGPKFTAPEIPAGGPAIQAAPKNPTNLGDPAQKKAWGIAKVGADIAWGKEKGSRKVIVAVIDSGVDYN